MKQHRGTGVAARRAGVAPHTTGELEAWGGIVCGHVTDWADAIGCDPETVLHAADAVDILLDTAAPKGQGKDRDRPEDPSIRCLALTAENARRLKDRVQEQDKSHD